MFGGDISLVFRKRLMFVITLCCFDVMALYAARERERCDEKVMIRHSKNNNNRHVNHLQMKAWQNIMDDQTLRCHNSGLQ